MNWRVARYVRALGDGLAVEEIRAENSIGYHAALVDYATAIYYTLSTIAQTLAGTLSVLVAVVLFNLSTVDEGIDLAQSIGFADAEALKDKERRSKLSPGAKVWAANAHLAWLVRPRLRRAVAVSLLDVTLCFAALPFTPRIASSGWHFSCWIVPLAGTTALLHSAQPVRRAHP